MSCDSKRKANKAISELSEQPWARGHVMPCGLAFAFPVVIICSCFSCSFGCLPLSSCAKARQQSREVLCESARFAYSSTQTCSFTTSVLHHVQLSSCSQQGRRAHCAFPNDKPSAATTSVLGCREDRALQVCTASVNATFAWQACRHTLNPDLTLRTSRCKAAAAATTTFNFRSYPSLTSCSTTGWAYI